MNGCGIATPWHSTWHLVLGEYGTPTHSTRPMQCIRMIRLQGTHTEHRDILPHGCGRTDCNPA